MPIQSIIDNILNNKPKFSNIDAFKGADELNSMQEVFKLLVSHYENNYDDTEKDSVIQCVHDAFDEILHNGHEPSFDNGHCWGYPVLAASICLIKDREELWNTFSDDDKERFDTLMWLFAVMWNFGCNKYNDFATGIGLVSKYRKNYSPNYQLTNNIIIPYIINYFGSQETVQKLVFKDHAELVKALTKFNFNNAIAVWNRPERVYADGSIAPSAQFLYSYQQPGEGKVPYKLIIQDNLGNRYGKGYGSGCQIPLAYCQLPNKDKLNLKEELITAIISETFSGGKCISRIYLENEDEYAECKNSVVSPYESQDGMMKEFNSADSYGVRTSLFHCEINFVLTYIHSLAFRYLNIVDMSKLDIWNKVKVGMNDFIFKKSNAYKGYSMGNYEDQLKKIESSFWVAKWNTEMGDDING